MRCTVHTQPKHCLRHSISFTFVWDGKCIFSQACGPCVHGGTAMPGANDAFKRQRQRFLRNTWMARDHPPLLWQIMTYLNEIFLSWMFRLFCSLVLIVMKHWSDGRQTDRCYLGSFYFSYCQVSWRLQSLFMKQNKAGSLLKTEYSPLAQKQSK